MANFWTTLPVVNNELYNSKERYFSLTSISRLKDNIIYPVGSVRIAETFIGRWDLASHVIYGNSNYWWVLLTYNDILDPFDPNLTGTIIQYPDLRDILEFLDSQQFRRI